MTNQNLFIGGIVSLTTVDFPGHLAAVVFFQGCPWRCLYCHNPHLQTILPSESLPWEDVLNLLRIRKDFLDGVVFSGGEPLAQIGLADAAKDIKDLGFSLGLHTGGADPNRFAEVINLFDWVGFDVKQTFPKYPKITGSGSSGELALSSLKILLESGVNYETRLTVDPSITIEDILELSKTLSEMGVKEFVLQKCRDKNHKPLEHPIFSDKLHIDEISKCFDKFLVRE